MANEAAVKARQATFKEKGGSALEAREFQGRKGRRKGDDGRNAAASKKEKERVLCPRCREMKRKVEFSADMLKHAPKVSIACSQCVHLATVIANVL